MLQLAPEATSRVLATEALEVEKEPVTVVVPAPDNVPPPSVNGPLDVEFGFLTVNFPEIESPPSFVTVVTLALVVSCTGRFGLPAGIQTTSAAPGNFPVLQLPAVFHNELFVPDHE